MRAMLLIASVDWMAKRFRMLKRLSGLAAVSTIVCLAQSPPAHKLADGKPDFNGIWEALNTASWDIQDHTGQLGIPPGLGVVEGNEIPYQPAALAKKKENFANRKTADLTEAKCYLPGVPRITYMPYPFQITQTPVALAFSYEFDHVLRVVHMQGEH